MIPNATLANIVNLTGQPLILVAATGLWWALGATDNASLMTVLVVLGLMAWVERLAPAMPSWRVSGRTALCLAGLYALTIGLSGLFIAVYDATLPTAFVALRESAWGQRWPRNWAWPVQALLLFFLSDLIYYWVHRSIHRYRALWRATGHGFHHAMQNLSALNTGSSHPFELVLVVLPLALLAALFDADKMAIALAGMLLPVNAVLVHANVRMATPGFSWIITSSDQHRRHHSAVFDQSNSNYACNAILWDRLFGTFGVGELHQTGIGPSQPTVAQLFMLPWREPRDADTIATRVAKSA